MVDVAYCPYCRAPLEDDRELPYVRTCCCPNCERPFAIVAFIAGEEHPFYCCLSLDSRTMESSDVTVKVEHVIRLVEPYLPLMGVSSMYRYTLRAEIAQQMSVPHEVTPDEFFEKGLFDSTEGSRHDLVDWRVEWVCECRYCGHEITSGRSVFPPSFRLKGDCPNCRKRLEISTKYLDRNPGNFPPRLARTTLPAVSSTKPVQQPVISNQEVYDFKLLLQRFDLGFPGGFRKK